MGNPSFYPELEESVEQLIAEFGPMDGMKSALDLPETAVHGRDFPLGPNFGAKASGGLVVMPTEMATQARSGGLFSRDFRQLSEIEPTDEFVDFYQKRMLPMYQKQFPQSRPIALQAAWNKRSPQTFVPYIRRALRLFKL
ncbi:MAG: hypothetical protein ACI9BD_001227 [Candidatus Marinamargulisbacteria bacterium]